VVLPSEVFSSLHSVASLLLQGCFNEALPYHQNRFGPWSVGRGRAPWAPGFFSCPQAPR